MIEIIKQHRQIISIYLCKEHDESEQNPLFDPKVHDDITFKPNTGWEFKVRLGLLGSCMKYRYDSQVFIELKRLRRIEQQSLSAFRLSAEVIERPENQSSSISNVYPESRPAE